MRLDYLIPDQLDCNMIRSALSTRFRCRIEPARREKRAYYDSFDWRLYDGKLVLEDRTDGKQRRLVLRQLNSSQPVAEDQVSRRPTLVQNLSPGRLRDALAPVLEMRELLPLVSINATVQCLSMLNKQDKTIARVLIEAGTLQTPKRTGSGRPVNRVSVLPVRGYPKPVRQIMRELEALQLVPETGDPALTSLAMAGITPGGYSSKLDLQLSPDMRSDHAIRVILHHLLDTMARNEAGTRSGTDTEHLHDFRVAVRRTRSALTQIREVLPASVLIRYKREFSWLGGITSNTRDMDVYLLSFNDYRNSLPAPMQADLDPLRDFLLRHRQLEHKALVKALDSARYRRLVDRWKEFLERPVNERSTLPNAQRPAQKLACKQIWRVYRRILKEGGAITVDTPAEVLHELRKTAKKLRYLMEFFQSLFPPRRIRQLISVLKDLQDNLGNFQDFEVQINTLRHFSQQMVDENMAPAATLLAMGMLIEGLERRKLEVREEFASRFGKFSLPENQTHFREMFTAPAHSEND
jgi:CHAD domain-containing protein